MNNYYTRQERLDIVLNLRRQLQKFPTRYSGQTVDLYQDVYICIPELKSIFKQYVSGFQSDTKNALEGRLDFVEIGMHINYILPYDRNIQSQMHFSKIANE